MGLTVATAKIKPGTLRRKSLSMFMKKEKKRTFNTAVMTHLSVRKHRGEFLLLLEVVRVASQFSKCQNPKYTPQNVFLSQNVFVLNLYFLYLVKI